jgi:hypothetical protein
MRLQHKINIEARKHLCNWYYCVKTPIRRVLSLVICSRDHWRPSRGESQTCHEKKTTNGRRANVSHATRWCCLPTHASAIRAGRPLRPTWKPSKVATTSAPTFKKIRDADSDIFVEKRDSAVGRGRGGDSKYPVTCLSNECNGQPTTT